MIRKFRVWDKKLKRMAGVSNIDFKNKIVQSVYWDSDHQCLIQANFDDVEFMQSTGLSDKNGFEIFEADIVKNINTDSIGRVFWNIHNTGYFYTIKRKNTSLFDDFTVCRSKYNLEIIGNIYENKELLGDDENFE